MKFIILGGLFFLIAVILAVHQYIFYGMWFSFDDIHHEAWMIMFIFAGIVLIALKRG